MRISAGYDRHLLNICNNGKIKVAGIEINCNYSVVAHSDGDVVMHSIADAVSSVFLRRTIGEIFPDTESKYKGADSCLLLKEIFHKSGCPKIINVDVIIISDQIMVREYSSEMIRNIANILHINDADVSIKGRRKEEINSHPAIECFCTILFE